MFGLLLSYMRGLFVYCPILLVRFIRREVFLCSVLALVGDGAGRRALGIRCRGLADFAFAEVGGFEFCPVGDGAGRRHVVKLDEVRGLVRVPL